MIGWGDTGVIAADPTQSKIAGKVGSAILPGLDRDLEPQDQEVGHVPARWSSRRSWRSAAGRRRCRRPAKNKEAAWSFVQTLTNPEVSGQAVVTGGTGVNPYRLSHVQTPLAGPRFPTARPRSISAPSRPRLDAKNVALDMRLPGYFSYTEVLEIELSQGAGRPGDAAAGAR